jgi:membrane-associated phospholipid phosphatase
MSRVFAIISFLVLVVVHTASGQPLGQNASQRSIGQTFVDDFMIGLEDASGFFTIPFRLTARDALPGGAFLGATALSLSIDGAVERRLRRASRPLEDYWEIPYEFGTVAWANIFSVGLYGAGLFTGTDDVRITGRVLFEALSFSGVVIIATRYLFGRTRPRWTGDHWEFKGFQPAYRAQSFPSGHAAVAFVLSTVLSERINTTWARVGLHTMAVLCCYVQVATHRHWLSDAVVGGALGVGTSLYVLGREEGGGGADNRTKLSIYPSAKGLTASLIF